MSKKSRKRSKYCVSTQVFVSLLALVLVLGCAVGGTIAWLTAETAPVVNTFTVGDIKIDLTETYNTDTDNDGVNDKWQAQLIPGFSYDKDPKVSVEAGSEDCYLFVKFEEKNSPANCLTYTSNLTAANSWTQGDGTDIPANVWYRKVMASDTTRSWELLSGNTIAVKDTLTKDNMPAATATPELAYSAYAVQLYKSAGVEFTAAEAWAKIN